jgi:hypothetical protein
MNNRLVALLILSLAAALFVVFAVSCQGRETEEEEKTAYCCYYECSHGKKNFAQFELEFTADPDIDEQCSTLAEENCADSESEVTEFYFPDCPCESDGCEPDWWSDSDE